MLTFVTFPTDPLVKTACPSQGERSERCSLRVTSPRYKCSTPRIYGVMDRSPSPTPTPEIHQLFSLAAFNWLLDQGENNEALICLNIITSSSHPMAAVTVSHREKNERPVAPSMPLTSPSVKSGVRSHPLHRTPLAVSQTQRTASVTAHAHVPTAQTVGGGR